MRTLKLSADALIPVPSSASSMLAQRRYDSKFDCAKLERTLGLCLPL
jgi:hypothetical protein